MTRILKNPKAICGHLPHVLEPISTTDTVKLLVSNTSLAFRESLKRVFNTSKITET